VDAHCSHRLLLLWPALAAIVLFLPTLRGDFVYDDRALLSLNPQMQEWEVLGKGFTTPFWQLVDPDRDASGFYRPMAAVSFGTLWKVGGGQPWPFQLFGILLHAGCAVLLTRLMWQLGASPMAGMLGGLLFALLGAHVEAVAWISAIPDLFATLASLLAMLAFARSRYWSCGAFLLLALLAKESAISAALFLGMLALFRQRKALLPLLAAGGVWYLLRVNAFESAAAGFDRETTQHGLSGIDQLFLSLSLLGQYLAHLVWPWPHPIFESLRLDLDWQHPARWGWALLGVGVFALSLLGLWRQRHASMAKGLPWLGVVFLFFGLLPVLNTKALGQYPFEERFLYLPSIGFAVALTLLLHRMPWKSVAAFAFLGLFAGNAFSAYQGQKPWQNEDALFTWARKSSPLGVTGHIEYGRLQLEMASQTNDPLTRSMHTERALQAYEQSLDISPDEVLVTSVEREKGNLGLGDALYLEGDFENALTVYQRTVNHYKFSPLGYLGVGNCKAQEGLKMFALEQPVLADVAFLEALEAFDNALAQKPGLQNALTGKANALAQMGRYLEAYGPALAAYEQMPQDLNALMLLLSINVATNRIEEAIGMLQAFQQRYPDHPRGQDVATTLQGLQAMQQDS
jgi:tetratricopeptide (TPR) repeat protein